MKLTTSKYFISALVAVVIAMPFALAGVSSIVVGNPPPAFTDAQGNAAIPSDGGIDKNNPINLGGTVTFTTTATDPNGDDYYFAVCKSDSITPQIASKPVCNDGEWVISGLIKSGQPASLNYIAGKDAKLKNDWYAFVCDNVAKNPNCSKASQGKGADGSPFYLSKQVGALRFGADCPDIAALDQINSPQPDSATTQFLDTNVTRDQMKQLITDELNKPDKTKVNDELKFAGNRIDALKSIKKKNGSVSDVQINAMADYLVGQRDKLKKLSEYNVRFCITDTIDDSLANIVGKSGKTLQPKDIHDVKNDGLDVNFSKDEKRTIKMDIRKSTPKQKISTADIKGPSITYKNTKKQVFVNPVDETKKEAAVVASVPDVIQTINLKHENFVQVAQAPGFFDFIFGGDTQTAPETTTPVSYDMSVVPQEKNNSVTVDEVIYNSSDNRKTDIYQTKSDPTSVVPNIIKNYTIYHYGNGTEAELYSFDKAVLHLRADGVIEGYYVDSTDLSGQQGAQGVDNNLLARAASVISRDQINDLHTNGGQNPVFTIPAPFAVDSAGNVIEGLTYEITGESFNQLKVTFTADPNSYPVVLDPTLQFTAYGTTTSYGAGTLQAITGETTSTSFGTSFASGDFNNDGKQDLAIGANSYSSNTGRVYIFYNDGNIPTVANSADVIITGESTSNFGRYIVSGDFNGDGKADIAAVGRQYNSQQGRTYIFYQNGTNTFRSDCTTACTAASNSNVIITGDASSYFGYHIIADDFNSDGKTDLVIGANFATSFTGKAYIFYQNGTNAFRSDCTTGCTAASNSNVIITGQAANDQFANAFISGDFNSDGKTDLVIGAYNYSAGGNTGRTYIFYQNGTSGSTFRSDCTTACTAASNSNVIITGEATNNYFGNFFAAGDLNNDGKTDLAVGAYGYNSNQGRAYIYYQNGTPGSTFRSDCTTTCAAATNANVIITGETTTNFFSQTAISAGDFNNDGKTDLAVGAYGYSNYTGRVYVFYQNGAGVFRSDCTTACSAATNADLIITGETTTNDLGFNISTGDFNNDGKTDLFLGAYYYSSQTGRAYILYNNSPTLVGSITGETTSNNFGFFSTSGDFNNDGKTDLAVGATSYSTSTGRVYIFYNDGSISTAARSADVIITGEATNNIFGGALVSGDLNADGKTDLVVSSENYSTNVGRVYIFYQNGTGVFRSDCTTTCTAASNSSVIITGAASGYFGSYMTVGDLGGDNKTDLVVGASIYNSNQGRVYIFYGDGTNNFGTTTCSGTPSACSATNADLTITGDAGSYFGDYIATGDFGGDTRTDLIVGSPFSSSNAGKAYIFYNDGTIPTTAATADVIISGESGYFGFPIIAGDFNTDGTTDIAAVADQYNSLGRIYIFYNDGTNNFGTATCSGTPALCNASAADVIITGETGNMFGRSIVAGDFNGDGKTDISAGANTYNSNQGRVYIYYQNGTSGSTFRSDCTTGCLAANSDVIITGETTSNYFGHFITSGDFDADGKIDLVVGAYGYSTNTGRVYIFYGQGGVEFKDTITGGATGDNFGVSLASGDFNNDGRTDLAVGAHVYNSNQGRVYIFYNDGSITTSAASADVIISGESASQFGVYLFPGDFNNDGKTDLAVGGYNYNSLQGRVYIIYNDGSYPSDAASSDVIITGQSANDNFGYTFVAGDFNADGKIDLVVGAYAYSSGASAGRAYIFYQNGTSGSTFRSDCSTGCTATSNSNVIITGESGSSFGWSMTSGDFNNDGKIDLVVGGYGYSSSLGRAYIFYNDGTNNFGNTTCSGAPALCNASSGDLIITGATAGASFGYSFASNDFNSDGRTDIAVGAYGYNSSQGRAYIFYNDGNIPTAAGSADVIITGEATGNRFARSFVSGDFNADGRIDLVIGAYYYNTNVGRSYIFYQNGIYGSTFRSDCTTACAAATNANVMITGEAAGDNFSRVLDTGDYNYDGKTDLAVTSWGYSGSTGRVYIYYNESGLLPANTPTTPGYTNLTTSGMRLTWASGGNQTDYAYGTTSSCLDGTTTNTYLDITGQSANTSVTRYVCARNADGLKTSALTIGPYYTAANTPGAPIIDNPSGSLAMNVTPVSGGAEKDVSIYVNPGTTCTYSGGVGYVQSDGTISSTEIYQPVSTWGTIAVTGLNWNNQIAFCTRARNGSNVVTAISSVAYTYTSAYTPSAPSLTAQSANSFVVDPIDGGNYKDMSIYAEAGSSCDYSGGLGYVQADGTIGASEIFQTDSAWGSKTVTGFSANTQYSFCSRARNNDNDLTPTGPVASAYTYANVPVTPGYTNLTTSGMRLTWASGGSQTAYAYGTTSSCLDGTTTNTYLDITGQSANTSVTRYICARNVSGVKTSALTIGPYYTAADVPTTAGHILISPASMEWTWASGGTQAGYAYGTSNTCSAGTTTNTYWGEPWYSASWSKRFKITPSSMSSDLYYDLSLAPSGFWNNVRSDGGDIRVTKEDGITEIPREVSGFDYSGHKGSLFIGTGSSLVNAIGGLTPDSYNNGPANLELGMRFYSDVDGFVTELRYLRGSSDTVAHTGRLWSPAGALLSTVTFPASTTAGWQAVPLTTPISIKANLTYQVSYSATYYTYDDNGLASQIDNGHLHIPANGGSQATTGAFATYFVAANYFVDIGFTYGSFYVYYGNASATEPAGNSTYGSQAVWDSRNIFVMHGSGANDSTSAQNNGTQSSVGNSTGKLGGLTNGARNFNGTTSYIMVPHNANQLATSGYTLLLWAKLPLLGGLGGEGNAGRFFNKSADLSATNGFLVAEASNGQLNIVINGVQKLTSVGSYALDSTWQHIVLTVDSAGKGKAYFNGVQGTWATDNQLGLPSSLTTTSPLYIGNRAENDRTLYGDIDEVRYLNTVISPTEVATMYASQNNPSNFWIISAEDSVPSELVTLSANTSYTRYVCATNGDGVKTSALTIGPFYTAANTPSAPTLSNSTTSGFDVNPVSGGAEKEMAIYIAGSSANCNGISGTGYVQANGAVSGTVAWQTDVAWSTKTVTGLSGGTYYVCAKARNGDNYETIFGSTSSINVNSAPSYTFTSALDTAGATVEPGDTVRVTATLSDPDSDNVQMYVCASGNTFAGGVCSGTEYCHTNLAAPGSAYCDLPSSLTAVPTNHGSYNFEIFVKDAQGLAGSAASTQSYTVTDTPPTLVSYTITDAPALSAGSSDAMDFTALVQDDNGEGDIVSADGSFFDADQSQSWTSGLCTADETKCYNAASCTLNTSAGDSSQTEVQCSVTVWFNANASSNWEAHVNASDAGGKVTNFANSDLNIVNSALQAIGVSEGSIAYGSLIVGATSSGQSVTVVNMGNQVADLLISGSDMCTDYSACAGFTIPRNQQKWSQVDGSDFNWGTQGHPLQASASAGDANTNGCANIDLAVRASHASTATNENIYWKLSVPSGQATGLYTGSSDILSTSSPSCTGTP